MCKRQSLHIQLILPVILFLSPGGIAVAALLDKGFKATYDVEHNGMYLGESERVLQPLPDGHWQFRSVTRAKGVAKWFIKDTLEETSILKRHALSTFEPVFYRYDQSGGKREVHDTVRFNWEKKQVSLSHDSQVFDLAEGTQDLMSFTLLIMQQLQNKHKQITFRLADRKRVRDYTLNVTGEVDVQTPMREFKSLLLVSNTIKDGVRFRIWCAPALQYLPVKIEKTEADGDSTTMTIKSLSINK